MVFGESMKACGLIDWTKIDEKGQLIVPIENNGVIEVHFNATKKE